MHCTQNNNFCSNMTRKKKTRSIPKYEKRSKSNVLQCVHLLFLSKCPREIRFVVTKEKKAQKQGLWEKTWHSVANLPNAQGTTYVVLQPTTHSKSRQKPVKIKFFKASHRFTQKALISVRNNCYTLLVRINKEKTLLNTAHVHE